MLHASLQMEHVVASSLTHLRTLNSYVVGALGAMGHSSLPRQAGGGAENGGGNQVAGVSAFAFQVWRLWALLASSTCQ